jgi:hypothetical protein
MDIALGSQLRSIDFFLLWAVEKFQRLAERIYAKTTAIKAILFDKATESQSPPQSFDPAERLNTVSNSVTFDTRD